jgi:glycosyltransferase involved in cell wall biosynthesis
MYPYFRYPFFGMVVKEETEILKRNNIDVEVVFVNGIEHRMNYFTKIYELTQLLKTRKFDIIHVHHTYCAYMAFVAQLLLRKKIPIILTLHEGEICRSRHISYSIDLIERLKYNKSVKKFAIHKVDHVVTVYEDLLRGFSDVDYSVLPCGVNLNTFQPLSKQECRIKLGIPRDAKVIFFPNLPNRPEKRFDLVQTAYKYLEPKYMPNLVLMTGGGIEYERMSLYFNASDVAALSSDYEASPMVIKEAMATNTPIVSVDAGDVKNLIRDLPGCFIADRSPLDIAGKLEQAINFNQKTQGRNRINDLCLSNEQVVAKIINIYDQIIEKN